METLKLITLTHFELLIKVIGYVLIFFWMRTRFRYSLINKPYKPLVGGNKFHNNGINSLWEEQEDIKRFNALFEMKATVIQMTTAC